jgi:spore coat polysaccharide biosynthesis protein SpsF
MPRIVIIIQARMSSTRLPGKVLLPLNGRPVLSYVVERCRRSMAHEVVVAISDTPADDPLEQWCGGQGYTVLRGSEDDVLSRYVMAAEQTHADIIVRITSDCPASDPAIINRVIQTLLDENVDYAHARAEPHYPDALPRGLNTEVFWRRTLNELNLRTTDAKQREHVTYRVEQDPFFRIIKVPTPVGLARPDYRITLDTANDLAMLTRLFAECPVEYDTPIERIITFMDAHPDIVALNTSERQKKI